MDTVKLLDLKMKAEDELEKRTWRAALQELNTLQLEDLCVAPLPCAADLYIFNRSSMNCSHGHWRTHMATSVACTGLTSCNQL